MRPAFLWGAIVAGMLVIVSAQNADARTIVVVGLAAAEGVSANEAERLGNAVAAAARERGHEVLSPAEAATAIDARTPGCISSRRPSCWASACRAMGQEIVVSGRVARDPRTGELSITLEAIDTESVRAVAEASHRAVGASPEELDALARAVTSTLLDALPAPRRRARLSVTSDPSGAAITINSRLVGECPWSGEVTEGPTTVLVELEGHVPQSRTFSLQADEVQEVHVSLAVDVGAGGGRRRGPHHLDGLDAVLLGTAGVGILGGTAVVIASIAPADECVGEPDPSGECPRVRQAGNLWPWAGVIGVGIAAGILVGVRYIIGDALPVQPMVDAEARTLGIAGQF